MQSAAPLQLGSGRLQVNGHACQHFAGIESPGANDPDALSFPNLRSALRNWPAMNGWWPATMYVTLLPDVLLVLQGLEPAGNEFLFSFKEE